MSNHRASLLDTNSLDRLGVVALFAQADALKKQAEDTGYFGRKRVPDQLRTVALVFLEPSTRTRMSFEMAALRWGAQTLMFGADASTSMAKGESTFDAILNIAALKPDAMVIRYGQDPDVEDALAGCGFPVINAGRGITAHPTQALLDAYTISRERGPLDQQRVLIVGDVLHSRVARSNIDLLRTMGAEIAVCAPPEFLLPAEEMSGVRVFKNLDDGVKWATVYMALRWQNERHGADHSGDKASFAARFGLNGDRLRLFAENGLIMHPGPVNHGVEMTYEAASDPRSRVLKQVTNGVWIRGALLGRALGFEI